MDAYREHRRIIYAPPRGELADWWSCPICPVCYPYPPKGKSCHISLWVKLGSCWVIGLGKSPFLLVILELNDNCPKSKTALAKVLLPQGKSELGSWAVIFQNFYINNFIRPYINNFYFFQLKKLKVITQLPKCSFYQQGQGF